MSSLITNRHLPRGSMVNAIELFGMGSAGMGHYAASASGQFSRQNDRIAACPPIDEATARAEPSFGKIWT